MRKTTKATIGIAAAAALVAGLAGTSVSIANAVPTQSVVKTANGKIPAPVAAVPVLKGGTTGVALDKGFTDALTALKLTPSMLGSGTLENGSVKFPITGGSVVYWSPKGSYRPYVQGILLHNGSGLRLTGGSTSVDLTNFTINPGNSILYGDVAVNGQSAAVQAPLFNLDGTTLKPLKVQGNNAILTGTRVLISQTAADTLNKVFGTTAVTKGLFVGTATITAQIK